MWYTKPGLTRSPCRTSSQSRCAPSILPVHRGKGQRQPMAKNGHGGIVRLLHGPSGPHGERLRAGARAPPVEKSLAHETACVKPVSLCDRDARIRVFLSPPSLLPPVVSVAVVHPGLRERQPFLISPLGHQVQVTETLHSDVRLEVGTTKTDAGRIIYLPTILRGVLESQWREHIERYPECPSVFPRHGKQIRYPYVAWRKACREAGLSDKIPHDCRRTAVRNMVRAGIPERVAMQIAGHKTRALLDRYHTVSHGDLREAAERVNRACGTHNGHTFGHTGQFSHAEKPLTH